MLVYVDVSGFARRALITKAGKEFVKARVGAKHHLPPPPPAHPSQSVTPNSGWTKA